MGRRVKVIVGKGPVSLPNGAVLADGEETVLTDAEYASVTAQVGVLVSDEGAEDAPGELPTDLVHDAELEAAVSAKQDANTAATDTELSTGLAGKQDASTAATDAELAAAIASVNPTLVGCRVMYVSSDQAMTTSTYNLIQWNTEDYDTDNFFDLTRSASGSVSGGAALTNPPPKFRFIVPTGKGGYYRLNAQVMFTFSATQTGPRNLYLYKNGNTLLSQGSVAGIGGSPLYCRLDITKPLLAGDYITVAVDCDEAESYSGPNSGATFFEMQKVG